MSGRWDKGDNVTVRSDLVEGGHYGFADSIGVGIHLNRAQLPHLGSVVTIISRDEDGLYEIKEDNGNYIWADDMFEKERLDI